MSRDAPSANKTKPLLIPEGPHFTVSLPNSRPYLSNRSVWTSSQVYPRFEALTQYSPLSTTDALKAPYSYPVPPLSPEWESPNCTLNTCIDGLGFPPS